jgi:hypothetical protein
LATSRQLSVWSTHGLGQLSAPITLHSIRAHHRTRACGQYCERQFQLRRSAAIPVQAGEHASVGIDQSVLLELPQVAKRVRSQQYGLHGPHSKVSSSPAPVETASNRSGYHLGTLTSVQRRRLSPDWLAPSSNLADHAFEV